jgi:hypothetical protein
MCVFVRVIVCVCLSLCVCVCVCVCSRANRCLRQAVEALLDENLATLATPSSLSQMMMPYKSAPIGSLAVFGGETVINISAALPYLESRTIVGTWWSSAL